MFILVQQLPVPAPVDRSPPVEALAWPEGLDGFLGRIGGWAELSPAPGSSAPEGPFVWVSLWKQTRAGVDAEAHPGLWHCLQDVEGIYDAAPAAVLSANHFHLALEEVSEERRSGRVARQRRDSNPRISRAPGFLAGAFAAAPAGRFLDLGLWQSSADSWAFHAGEPLAPRQVRVLRRFTLEAGA